MYVSVVLTELYIELWMQPLIRETVEGMVRQKVVINLAQILGYKVYGLLKVPLHSMTKRKTHI